MKKITLSILAAVFLVMNTAMAQTFTYPVNGKQGFSLSEKTRDGLHVNYNLGQFSLSPINYRGENMAEISISGMVLPNTEGYPNLPVESRLLAAPQGAEARLNVINLQSEIIRNVDIAPALRIQAEDEVPEFNYVKNRDVYEKNAFYPENPFTIDRSSIRGVDVVAVSVSPFQYNPVTKELKVYTNIELSVSFEGGNGHFGDDRLRSPYWDPILAAELMNYDQLPVIDYAARMQQWLRDDADGAEYLIITPNNDGWAEYANQLRDYRTRQGILTKVYRLDEMPATTTDAMKAWFHNAYNTWTIPPVAVLLFGDHNSNMAEGVPAEYTYHSSDYGDCITDNGYADPTGDNLPDMVFSRLVAANATEAQMMVSKQIEYEYSNPNMNASTYDHPITALGWQTERWFQICSEVVGGYWRNQGKHPVRINEIYDGEPGDVWSSNQNTTTVVNYFGPNGQGYIPATPSELGGWTGGTGAQVVNAVNSGAMLLQHRDHGYYQGWGEPDFSNSYVAQMNNVGKMTFVNTINCQTGTFDYSSNCLIEAFMRRTYNGQNAGAVGCIGPTQTSYSFVNDTYVWGMMDQYDPSFLPSYGPYASYEGNWQPAFGNVAGKYFLQQSSWPYNTGSKAITYKMFTAHCDAFLRLYTQVPRTMAVDHPVAVVAGIGEMDITAPQGCMISLVAQSPLGGWDILAVAEATGSAQTIGFEPQVPPTEINLVVTGQDYLRYEAVMSVLPAEGSYLAVIGYDPNSAPINQETPLSLTIKNVGVDATTASTTVTLTSLDSRLNILDDTEQVGVMASEATVTLTDAFSFIIDEDVADNTTFQINVTMTCGSQTWTGKVYVKAEQAVLKYEGMSWDGGFVPGETITVTANFKNTGHYQATNAVVTMISMSNYITISNPTITIGTVAVGQEVSCQYTVTISSNCPETAQIPVIFTMTASGGLTAQGNEVLKNACNVIFNLVDSYGDGWNGNKLIVSFNDGSPSEELTIESGSAAVETLEIGNGVHVTLTWSSGSYANECSFTVSYEGNLVIYQSSGTPQAGVLYEFDCNCAAASQTFTVTVASENTDHGTVSGGGEFSYGQSCTVVATPAEGYFFTNWTQNGEVVSMAASYSFYVNSDMNLVAHFAEGFLIGDGGTTTDQYLPSYNYYNYTLSQQIYTSEELGSAGNITSIAFYNGGAEKTRTYDFYLKNTTKSSFSSTTDWEVVSDADKVFSGTVTMAANAWTFITFNTPFDYDGTSNVVLVADDNSGAYTTSPHMACRVFDATSQAIRVYSDNTNYDPSVPSGYSGTLMNVKNQLLLTKETSTTGPLNITVSANPAEGGMVSGGGEYNSGATCTVTATPNDGYFFVNWTENGTVVSNDPIYSFSVSVNRALVANFIDGQYLGNGSTATNQYLPSYSYYNYTLSQQIYTASEIGKAGFINRISFFNDGAEKTRSYDIYMVHTDKSAFDSNTDWITVTESDLVFSGSVPMTQSDWTHFILNTPFAYNGTSNLAIVVDDNSGNWTNSPHMACRVFDAQGNQAIRVYSDGIDYDPYNPSGYNGTLHSVKNQIILGFLCSVTATANPAEGGTVTGTGGYSYGQTCTLTATPAEGYFFVNWTENGNVVSTETSYSFVVETDVDLVANFIEGNMIGVGGTATNQYLPSYNFYKYTLSQQIYTAEEIGNPGVITSIAFYNGGAEKTRTYDFYMKATDKASFSGASDWETVTPSDKVFSGTVTMAADAWTFINFDTPFIYYGTSNVVLVTDDNTGSYTSSPHMACRVFDATSQAIRIYSDGTNYDPSAPSGYNGTVLDVKNQLLFTKIGFSDCMIPTQLTATEVGPDFVELSWTENGASEQWYVVCNGNSVLANTNEDFILSGLDPETEYTITVCPVCNENLLCSAITVTTLDACPIPQDVVVSNITHSAATVTWSGYSDSYNVQLGCHNILLYEDFTEGIPSDWINSETYPWMIVDGHMQSGNAGVASSSSSISVTMTFPAAGTVEFDAECKGEGTSTMWDQCVFSIDDEAQFTYGANVSGWNHYSFAVAAGEHTFTWSYTKDSSVNPTGDYFAVDNVKVSVGEITWSNSVSVWNAEYTFIGLTATTNYCVRVQGVCGNTETEWSETVFFTTSEITTVTQTYTLSQGWNWFSTYVEITLDDLKAALVAALPGATSITIVSQSDGSTTYNGTRWRGQLNTIDLSQMYKIQTTVVGQLTLEGLPVNPAEHPVTIHNGNNWIAFPLGQSMSLTDAFAGFAVNGDMVISQSDGSSSYTNRWRGTLNTLESGKGYLYNSVATDDRTFIFGTNYGK